MAIHCPNCGAEQEGDEKFCGKCGQPLTTGSVQKENKPLRAQKKNYGVLSAFHISDDEFNTQVVNHDLLPITKSSRGIAVLTIIGLLIFGFVVIVFLHSIGSDVPISYSDVFLSLVLYSPLLYFVYKGNLWAVILLALLYTVDKLYSTFILSPSHFNIGAIFFWIIGIGPLWAAFRVERAYRKKKMLAATTN